MRPLLLITFLMTALIPKTYSQADTTSSMDALMKQRHDKAEENKPRKFGCTAFGGLGKGGNNTVTGFAAGGSLRAHYGIHTINAYATNVKRLEYSSSETSSSTLYATYYGLTYGVGVYDKNASASIGAGLGYSFVQMSTGGGINYKYTHYEKYGGCIGGQFWVHGKYVGFGVQTYFNLTQIVDYTWLLGLVVGVN